MQTSVPELMDISRGAGQTSTSCTAPSRARRRSPTTACWRGGWSSAACASSSSITGAGTTTARPGDDIVETAAEPVPETDQPVAALIKDLKQRGLLDDTLVIWGGEFGRTPMNEARNGSTVPRPRPPSARVHHVDGRRRHQAGHDHRRDRRLGYNVVEDPVDVHDLQATILHLLGIDHEKLTYRFQGRDFRLTDVHGKLVPALLAELARHDSGVVSERLRSGKRTSPEALADHSGVVSAGRHRWASPTMRGWPMRAAPGTPAVQKRRNVPICSSGRHRGVPLVVCRRRGALENEGRCLSRACSVSTIRVLAALALATGAVPVRRVVRRRAGRPARRAGMVADVARLGRLADGGRPRPARHHDPRRAAVRQHPGRGARLRRHRRDRRVSSSTARPTAPGSPSCSPGPACCCTESRSASSARCSSG